MGSPSAPVLADISISFKESKWLNEYSVNKPKFSLIYSSDFLATFDNEQDSLKKKKKNNRHLYIEFTIEKQIYHSIAFLDVIILGINNYNVTLETYHKSTYAELTLNFKSFTSFPYKIGLFKCLTGRMFKICDN